MTPRRATPLPLPVTFASTADPLDALVPAFVAALLAGCGDRPAVIAVAAAARWRGARVAAYLILLHLLAAAACAAAGALAAPLLAPSGRTLLLGIALAAGGIAALLPQGSAPLPRHGGAAALLLAGLVATDRAAFVTFALAAGAASPWLVAAGGALGGAAVTALALSDASVARVLPRIGRVAGGLLLIGGSVLLLRAAGIVSVR